MGLEINWLANDLILGAQDFVEWEGTKEDHTKADLGIYIIKVELFGLKSGTTLFKAVCILTDRLS